MVRLADESMMPALRALWQECFGDGDAYAHYVFSQLLSPQQMLIIADEADRPAAMLSWKLLRFLSGERSFLGAYVFGVATAPAYRRKGLSGRLMDALHEQLRGQSVALSALVPAGESLFQFYGDRGYKTAFSRKHVSVAAGQIPTGAKGGVLSASSLDTLEGTRNAQFADSRLYGAWDHTALRFFTGECRLLGGEVLRYSCAGRKGYAVCLPVGDALLVKELAVWPGGLDGLLLALHRRYSKARYELRLPEDFPCDHPGNILPFGMVQWYDREQEQTAMATGAAPWLAHALD